MHIYHDFPKCQYNHFKVLNIMVSFLFYLEKTSHVRTFDISVLSNLQELSVMLYLTGF